MPKQSRWYITTEDSWELKKLALDMKGLTQEEVIHEAVKALKAQESKKPKHHQAVEALKEKKGKR